MDNAFLLMELKWRNQRVFEPINSAAFAETEKELTTRAQAPYTIPLVESRFARFHGEAYVDSGV